MRAQFTNIRSLLGALAEAMNLINPDMEHHHEQTAYLSYLIAQEMGMSRGLVMESMYAALLHDVGSITSERPKSVLEIERSAVQVSAAGARMLRGLPKFSRIAEIIRFCQCSWESVHRALECRCCSEMDVTLAKLSCVVHLADRVSIMVNPSEPVLNQVKSICEIVSAQRGKEFLPEAVDAFLRISEAEYIWMDVLYHPSFLMIFTGEIQWLSLERAAELTRLMSRIIDYRSAFTAMHSAGVSASAKKLAQLSGMTEEEVLMMEIAGNLHDVGKLKVPKAILEKPGKLTEAEFNIIKEHTYYTRLILMGVDGFEKVADWAGFHHEKLNGKGYPFHMRAEELDLGSRIMSVADIFSAIAEVRPYRKGMRREQIEDIMRQNVRSGAICGEIVGLLLDNYEEVDFARDQRSRQEGERYFQSLERETLEESV